jgi:hypothetical protein
MAITTKSSIKVKKLFLNISFEVLFLSNLVYS